jgi:site-specific DNA-adenine methylase
LWSYYGRKTKLIKYYDKPKFDTIIEPFAGTAVYSLHEDNWKKNVILVDKYDVIIKIWRYLQQAKESDILSLPNIKEGESIDDHLYLCDEEKWLIGFCINRGSTNPKKTAKKFNSWDKDKIRIANDLHKIRHWDIRHGTYEEIENIEATWFIDPPYQKQGKYYKYNNKTIDYTALGEWCKSRKGQIIVCENIDADWLDFVPLKEFHGQLNKNVEAVCYINN